MTASTKVERAVVLRGGARVGTLTRTRDGSVFAYDAVREREKEGVAYRLPPDVPRVETHGVNLHPFFAGLLPEGFRLDALVRRVKTSKDDLFSLLLDAGADCIGDVSVVEGLDEIRAVAPAVDLGDLSNVRFADVLAESVAGKRGREPTLPGVQEKVSAAMISLPVRVRKAKAAAYLLKLEPTNMPCLLANEHFFIGMARACGLDVAKAEMIHDRDGVPGLLVERFDRVTTPDGVRSVHQEDACQFLDRYPADKYRIACADIARGIGELASAPVVETRKLVRLVAFSYLVANGDLHAKNVSLRTHLDDGRVELTPAYDLLTTLPYGDRTMALPLDGRDDNLKRRGLLEFAERFGVRRAAMEPMLDELCDVASTYVSELAAIGFDRRKTADLARVMKKRRDDLGATKSKTKT